MRSCRRYPVSRQPRVAVLAPPVWKGPSADGRHDIFVVSHVPVLDSRSHHHPGIDNLVNFMGRWGSPFCRSSQPEPTKGPGGIIAPDDIVLLKVNAAFDQRGMTNLDVIRGVDHRHPGAP